MHKWPFLKLIQAVHLSILRDSIIRSNFCRIVKSEVSHGSQRKWGCESVTHLEDVWLWRTMRSCVQGDLWNPCVVLRDWLVITFWNWCQLRLNDTEKPMRCKSTGEDSCGRLAKPDDGGQHRLKRQEGLNCCQEILWGKGCKKRCGLFQRKQAQESQQAARHLLEHEERKEREEFLTVQEEIKEKAWKLEIALRIAKTSWQCLQHFVRWRSTTVEPFEERLESLCSWTKRKNRKTSPPESLWCCSERVKMKKESGQSSNRKCFADEQHEVMQGCCSRQVNCSEAVDVGRDTCEMQSVLTELDDDTAKIELERACKLYRQSIKQLKKRKLKVKSAMCCPQF